MSITCIVACNKNSLIRRSIVNLLGTAKDELLVIESEATTLGELEVEINQNLAKIIVLENSNSLAKSSSISSILTLHPKLSVIVVREETNWLQIFRHENKLLSSSADLLEIINSLRN